MALTGLQLSEKILRETKKAMSSDEMWKYAVEKGYDKQTNIHGKTPWHTIQAQMYVNMQRNPNSVFAKVAPSTFGLKELTYTEKDFYSDVKKDPKGDDRAIERDLHPLLVAFVNSDDHFHGYTKTIYHEKSSKSGKNGEKWMHPDLVAVRLPFDDISQSSIALAKNAGIDTITIFSFEMKREITASNVREYYFQAVSNSSWANEGYLVAPVINEKAIAKLARLNASFGIGVIKLNVEDVYQSEILFPSRDNELDIGMIDELARINDDFKGFISAINDSMHLNHFVDGKYDAVLESDELADYIKKKKIDKMVL